MAQAAKTITDANFEQEVMMADKPVLLDFWAEWCGPCKTVGPILEELAAEMKDKVIIAKLNVDDNPQTASKFGIRSIPTLIMFKGGQVVANKIGGAPKLQLKQWIESQISAAA